MKIEDLEGVGPVYGAKLARRRASRPRTTCWRRPAPPPAARALADERRHQPRPAPALGEPRRPVPDLWHRLRVRRPARGERRRLVRRARPAQRGEPGHHDGRGERGPLAGPAAADRGGRGGLDRPGEAAAEGRHALTRRHAPSGPSPARGRATCGRASSCASCPRPCRPCSSAGGRSRVDGAAAAGSRRGRGRGRLGRRRGDRGSDLVEAPHRVEAALEADQPDGIQAVVAARPLGPLQDESGRLQHAEVLRDRRPADGEVRRQVADGPLAVAEALHDGPPRGVAEGFEGIGGGSVSVHER